jgi:hypothetical protein
VRCIQTDGTQCIGSAHPAYLISVFTRFHPRLRRTLNVWAVILYYTLTRRQILPLIAAASSGVKPTYPKYISCTFPHSLLGVRQQTISGNRARQSDKPLTSPTPAQSSVPNACDTPRNSLRGDLPQQSIQGSGDSEHETIADSDLTRSSRCGNGRISNLGQSWFDDLL